MTVPTAWFPVSPHTPHSAGPALSPGIAHAVPMPLVRRMGVSEVRSAPTSPRSAEQDAMIDIEPTTQAFGRPDTVFTYHRNDPFSPEGRSTIQVYREDALPQADRSPYSQVPTHHVTAPTSPEVAHLFGRGQENKENSEHYEGRYPYLENDPMHFSDGLFVKPRGGGRVGKELRNSLYGVEFLKRESKERERDKKHKGERVFVWHQDVLDLSWICSATARSAYKHLERKTLGGKFADPADSTRGAVYFIISGWRIQRMVL